METHRAAAIRDELRDLISNQIDTFKQRTSLTSAQLQEFHSRALKIRTLYEELDECAQEAHEAKV
jgi:hypothetical protein